MEQTGLNQVVQLAPDKSMTLRQVLMKAIEAKNTHVIIKIQIILDKTDDKYTVPGYVSQYMPQLLDTDVSSLSDLACLFAHTPFEDEYKRVCAEIKAKMEIYK